MTQYKCPLLYTVPLGDDDLTHAIQLGHAKINFNTEVKKAWAQKLREVLDNDPSLYEPQSIIQPAKDAIEAAVTRLIQTCHSDGKLNLRNVIILDMNVPIF
ncbi:hypothetical protein CD158_07035 [Staphylococcus auricularis]|uniref:Uncharacterized protein n=1 Tax=Staphylococcus auricularis TaxID=29379 RepID=A0AAP8PNT2_9STAP|nr:hypothetical protein CD158_07035 [Staphylococcus auricularis]